MDTSRHQGLRPAWITLILAILTLPLHAVEISETTYEGRDQFLIRTETAVWYYDRAGGGFSRLIDIDGHDWISFSKNPLKEYPASAAAGYRGMPNLLFGRSNPDAGAGHPGFDQCETLRVDGSTLRTKTKSGRWQWSWRFTDHHATFTMEQLDPNHAWWFLYEGPIAGSFNPRNKFWATDQTGLSTKVPSNANPLFGQWQWVYFGDRKTPRVLFLIQHRQDELPDTLWYLGSSQKGSPQAKDGMMVFGFGRGRGTRPQFKQNQVRVTVGFLPCQPSSSGLPLTMQHTRSLQRKIEKFSKTENP